MSPRSHATSLSRRRFRRTSRSALILFDQMLPWRWCRSMLTFWCYQTQLTVMSLVLNGARHNKWCHNRIRRPWKVPPYYKQNDTEENNWITDCSTEQNYLPPSTQSTQHIRTVAYLQSRLEGGGGQTVFGSYLFSLSAQLIVRRKIEKLWRWVLRFDLLQNCIFKTLAAKTHRG